MDWYRQPAVSTPRDRQQQVIHLQAGPAAHPGAPPKRRPGLVIERTDDYVDIPFGAGRLYWQKQVLPLALHHQLRQHREDAAALHHLSGICSIAAAR